MMKIPISKNMETFISKIKPNPYRDNLGSFNEPQISRLLESYRMSDFGKNQRFEVRKNGDGYQLIYGHHRLEALKRFLGKGKDAPIEVIVRDYDDKIMLQELLRENLTQEERWFSFMQALVTVKKFLQSQNKSCGYESIAKFLSQEGKTVDRSKVEIYLTIAEKIKPKLLKEVSFNRKSQEAKDYLSLKQAYYLSRFAPDEQEDLAKALKACYIQDHTEQRKYLGIYRSLGANDKQLVRKGKINLAMVPNLVKRHEVFQIKRLKPKIEEMKKSLSGNGLAAQFYASLMDLRDTLAKTQKLKVKEDVSNALIKLCMEVARELTRQSKILKIENLKTGGR
jgi:hypothetical protein